MKKGFNRIRSWRGEIRRISGTPQGFKFNKRAAQTAFLKKILSWHDPDKEEIDLISIVDKKRGKPIAGHQLFYVSLADYNKVCRFMLSLQELAKQLSREPL